MSLTLAIVGQGEDDIAQESRPLEPPMSKQLGIERRDANALPARAVTVFAQHLPHHVAEMLGVFVQLGGHIVGIIRVLVAEASFVVGDFPISQAALAVFFVEFEIDPLPGYPMDPLQTCSLTRGMSAEGKTSRRFGPADDAGGL